MIGQGPLLDLQDDWGRGLHSWAVHQREPPQTKVAVCNREKAMTEW